jgi:hypothetical protein
MLVLNLWVLLLVVAVLNGYVREVHVAPYFGEWAAQWYGVVVVCGVIWLAAAYYARGTRGARWGRWAAIAAVLWVVLTVGFEFLFGHYVQGAPWNELLSAYAIWNGKLWPLVPLTEAISPVVMGSWANRAYSGESHSNNTEPKYSGEG